MRTGGAVVPLIPPPWGRGGVLVSIGDLLSFFER